MCIRDRLNRARKYVHIITPYLILDGELETALRFAAERGVDVHLILPGKPDKWFAYALAKTHYEALLSSGVKISEWTPGFTHAKVVIADDVEAVAGTINLDYRSPVSYTHLTLPTKRIVEILGVAVSLKNKQKKTKKREAEKIKEAVI